jgi:hypothetical protein
MFEVLHFYIIFWSLIFFFWGTGVAGSYKLRNGTLRQISTDPADSCPKTEPWEQRGLTLYTLASKLQKQKQNSTHMWLHVTLLAISFPQCYVTFMFQFFQFYLCFAISSPVLSSEHSLYVFFSTSPSCYIVPPFDAQTHPRSKSIILI